MRKKKITATYQLHGDLLLKSLVLVMQRSCGNDTGNGPHILPTMYSVRPRTSFLSVKGSKRQTEIQESILYITILRNITIIKTNKNTHNHLWRKQSVSSPMMEFRTMVMLIMLRRRQGFFWFLSNNVHPLLLGGSQTYLPKSCNLDCVFR